MRKRKSVFKIIFRIIFFLILIVVLALAGLGCFVYFKFHVNPIGLISQFNALKNANVGEFSSNAFSSEDYESANTKLNSSENIIRFTDKEVGAFLNINKNLFDVNDINTLKGYEIVELNFSNIPENMPSDDLVDLSIILKIDLSGVKANLNKFLQVVVGNFIPNSVYLKVTTSLDTIETEPYYEIKSTEIQFANLSKADSENVFKLLKNLNLIEFDNLKTELGEELPKAVVGDTGFYGACKAEGAQDYAFEKTDSSNNFVIYKLDTTQTKTITYLNTKGATNNNVEEFYITYNEITLQDISANGYKFLGWFMLVDGVETKVESINANNFVDYTLTAKWEIVEYSIKIHLNGGKILDEVDDLYETNYTIETSTFTLPTPSKTLSGVDCPFKGYLGTNLDEITILVTINQGSFGDLEYYAYYTGETKTVTLNIDGSVLDTLEIGIGEKLNKNDILNPTAYGMSGYYVDNWFTNSNKTSAYNFGDFVLEDFTLYGEFEYVSNNIYFYDYISTFNSGVRNGSLSINDHKMMIAYIDYVVFYNVKTKVRLDLSNYTANTAQSIINEIESAYNDYSNGVHYSSNYTYGYATTTEFFKVYGQFYITTDIIHPTNVIDASKEYVYTQQDYAMRTLNTNPRANDFDDFNIEKVKKAVSVSTSAQLVWVLENGYKPICEEGSEAESVYNLAKQVLKQIVNDDMTEIEKLKSIYEWLILNVQYDQLAYNISSTLTSDQARSYDSWSIEGVFNNKKAVCEGYAKALLVMAQIENIPTIYVTGNGHAWNKVLIDGNWFGIDATHGDEGNSSKKYEVLTYRSFLFTDAYKESLNYTADDYKNFKATTVYDVYSNTNFESNSTEYSLLISSASELTELFKYVKNYSMQLNSDYYTFEFALTTSNAIHYTSWFNIAKTASHLNVFNSYSEESDSAGHLIYRISVYAD